MVVVVYELEVKIFSGLLTKLSVYENITEEQWDKLMRFGGFNIWVNKKSKKTLLVSL